MVLQEVADVSLGGRFQKLGVGISDLDMGQHQLNCQGEHKLSGVGLPWIQLMVLAPDTLGIDPAGVNHVGEDVSGPFVALVRGCAEIHPLI